MADETRVSLLQSHLRKGGYVKEAQLLRDAYVLSHLTVLKPSEPWLVRLPSGRSISCKKPRGLAELAATIEQLHRASRTRVVELLDHALKHEMQVVQARCEGNPWLSITKPYRRLAGFISQPSKLAEEVRIRQLWRQYQGQPHGISRPLGVGPRILRELGFSGVMYAALDQLATCNPEEVVVALLRVIQSHPSVLRYETDPICQLLQQAQVLPNAARIPRTERVDAVRRRVLAIIRGFHLHQGEGLHRLLTLITSEDRVTRVAANGLLRTLSLVGETYGLKELTRAAYERKRALMPRSSDPPRAAVGAPQRKASRQVREAPSEWLAVSKALNHVDPGLPDEVMRSLLAAALKRTTSKKRYGLPSGEYWVACPDRVLERVGIQRLTFMAGTSGLSIQCVTSPLDMRFSLGMPPTTVTRGALLAALVAAITYEAMVTQRENFTSTETKGMINLRWANASRSVSRAAGPSRTVVARVRRTGVINRTNGPIQRENRASFVVPHLRLLRPGGLPSARAAANAAEHGIRLPTGYTFVRGHLRGAEGAQMVREFSVAEIALETIARLRRQEARGMLSQSQHH